MWFLKNNKQEDNGQEATIKQEVREAPVDRNVTVEEMYKYVQDRIIKDDDVASIDEKQNILADAMSGDLNAKAKTKEYIRKYLRSSNMTVKGWNEDELVTEIFAYGWGLGAIEKYYDDKDIDEIQVNSPNNIYIVKKGIQHRIKESFKNDEEVETVIKRMIINDVGISLDRSSPRIESVRKDGSRLTATCGPVTKHWTFALRLHTSFTPTLENYIKARTLDSIVWKALSVLVRGRASLLISGNVGAGKTTLMKKLVGELHERLRILVIGKDLELRIADEYPDRNILELEEHAQVGATMKALFETGLRESPNVIIVEEFRGSGEAIEAVRACTRGLPGSMATAHFNSAEEAIEGTGLFMLEEGLNLPLELAKLRVARAFNIVVQMLGDSITGVKKVTSITEVYVDNNAQINYNELVRWVPNEIDNYLGEGKWEIVGKPSKKMLLHLIKNVSNEDLGELGWSL